MAGFIIVSHAYFIVPHPSLSAYLSAWFASAPIP